MGPICLIFLYTFVNCAHRHKRASTGLQAVGTLLVMGWDNSSHYPGDKQGYLVLLCVHLPKTRQLASKQGSL